MYLLLGIVIFGFTLIFAVNKIGNNILSGMLDLQVLAKDGRMDLLQARRQEKNFFMRKELKYIDALEKSVKSISDKLAFIKAKDSGMAGDCDKALAFLKAYQKDFQDMARIEQEIGLTEKEGLRWQFIVAARALEKEFKQFDDTGFVIGLLQMRRQEKNYQLRRSDEYLGKMNADRQKLVDRVDSSELSSSEKAKLMEVLKAYDEAWGAYVRDLKTEEETEASLIKSARDLEPAIEKVEAHYNAKRDELSRQLDLATLGIEISAAAVVTLIILWLVVSITRPLAALQAFAHEVAAGNLKAKPKGEFKAEFGQLCVNITGMIAQIEEQFAAAKGKEQEARENAEKAMAAMEDSRAKEARLGEMVERMRQVAKDADQIAERVSSASEELSAQAEQINKGAQLQRERVEETATAMEQMNATVMEVARNAGDASSNTSDARSKAEEGAEVVNRAVGAIQRVNTLAEGLNANMRQLGNQAESIDQVMNVISDIADQTNLLALNAAIEAARAGEAGRGFAVVADEVRKLAEKTMGATKEVGENIAAIQEATRRNIQHMEEAAMAAKQATELANESGQTLNEIVSLVEQNASQMANIATGAEQQSAASEQIHQALEDVNRIVGETTDSMGQSTQAIHELASMSENLRKLILELNVG
ncbi:MAG: HAMP domain-containing protein [Desulfovibrionaceae bacterium]|nr:HAMP domain-containing protein [Desulfovibrionaceae bacterium]